MENFLTEVFVITIFKKDIKEMGFLSINDLFIEDSPGMSSEGVKNTQLLS